MKKKGTYFTVGLFVIIGVIIAVSAVVWVGASQYFKKGDAYVTYFDESVQGLQVDSIVKYRGVDVGRVDKIRVAPDDRLIEVVMKINFGKQKEIEDRLVAKLELAGITGIVFVGLDLRKPGAADLSPAVDFPTDYPVIPSTPSDIKKILSGVDEVIGKLKTVDFKGISDQTIQTAKSIEDLAAGKKTRAILADIGAVAENLLAASDKINGALDKENLEKIMSDITNTVSDARQTLARIKKEVDNLPIAETGKKAERFIENVDARFRTVSTEIQLTAENLRRTSETLELLIQRLKADPSDILFSNPPPRKAREK